MRRIRVGGAAGAAMLSAVLVAGGCSVTPSGSTEPGSDATFAGVAHEDWRDDDMADASVRIAARMVALSGGQNIVVSPTSLQLSLAVLREGADGAAAVQLDDVLGLREASSQDVADLRAVLGEYEGDVAGIDPATAPETPLLHIADGLFVQPSYDLGAEFLNRVTAYHGAQVLEADADAAAKAALDAWVAAETGGLLTLSPIAPPVPPEPAVVAEGEVAPPPVTPEPTTSLAIMDVVTFGATWLDPFAPADTTDRPFTLPDGTQVPVPTMSQILSTTFAESEAWRAVELAYSDGFVMRVAVATDGGSPAWTSVADGLDDASEQAVHLVMPRWTAATALDLRPLVTSLGIGGISRPGNLDALYDAAYVSLVAQGARFTVAEGGTAAAATPTDGGGAAAPTAATVELILDRPFEYQVVHEATGMVIFAGRVANPSV